MCEGEGMRKSNSSITTCVAQEFEFENREMRRILSERKQIQEQEEYNRQCKIEESEEELEEYEAAAEDYDEDDWPEYDISEDEG